MKDIIILYHADCPDGFGGAWAAYKKFGDKAEYIAVHHQVSPPAGLKNKEIYFVDFIYNDEKTVSRLISDNKRVTAIDHHVSVEKPIRMTRDYLYDINHSGSVLAWKYFHPAKPVPKLLRYIEDTDLWKFKLPYSHEVFSYINLQDRNFKTFNKIAADLEKETEFKKYIDKGSVINQYVKKLVNRLVEETTETVIFEGHSTLIVNGPHFFASQIGEALCKKKPPIAIIWREAHNMINVSLRSDGSADVSKIARKYGGGGHHDASGFAFPVGKKAPWEKVK
jgi:uncharacterized protein